MPTARSPAPSAGHPELPLRTRKRGVMDTIALRTAVAKDLPALHTSARWRRVRLASKPGAPWHGCRQVRLPAPPGSGQRCQLSVLPGHAGHHRRVEQMIRRHGIEECIRPTPCSAATTVLPRARRRDGPSHAPERPAAELLQDRAAHTPPAPAMRTRFLAAKRRSPTRTLCRGTGRMCTTSTLRAHLVGATWQCAVADDAVLAGDRDAVEGVHHCWKPGARRDLTCGLWLRPRRLGDGGGPEVRRWLRQAAAGEGAGGQGAQR